MKNGELSHMLNFYVLPNALSVWLAYSTPKIILGHLKNDFKMIIKKSWKYCLDIFRRYTFLDIILIIYI